MAANGPGGFFLLVMKMSWNGTVVMVAQPREYTRHHMVSHVACE